MSPSPNNTIALGRGFEYEEGILDVVLLLHQARRNKCKLLRQRREECVTVKLLLQLGHMDTVAPVCLQRRYIDLLPPNDENRLRIQAIFCQNGTNLGETPGHQDAFGSLEIRIAAEDHIDSIWQRSKLLRN